MASLQPRQLSEMVTMSPLGAAETSLGHILLFTAAGLLVMVATHAVAYSKGDKIGYDRGYDDGELACRQQRQEGWRR